MGRDADAAPTGPLARLLLIAERFTESGAAASIQSAVGAGLPWVQLRDHNASDTAFEEAAMELSEQLWEISPNLVITVNSRVQTAARVVPEGRRVFGLHVGTRGPDPGSVRGLLHADALLGLSVHALSEIGCRGVDYYLWSPVFQTASKPDARATGTSLLMSAVERAGPVPVLALGGVTPGVVQSCLSAGAYGVAVQSGILGAADPAVATREYLRKIAEYS